MKKDRERQKQHDSTHMWNFLKIKANEQTKRNISRVIETKNKQMVAAEEGRVKGEGEYRQ